MVVHVKEQQQRTALFHSVARVAKNVRQRYAMTNPNYKYHFSLQYRKKYGRRQCCVKDGVCLIT